MKEEVNQKELSESTKKVYDALKEHGFTPTENSIIAFMHEEHDDEGYILFNFTSTDIHFKKSELDLHDLECDGIKVWGEWFFKG